MKNKTRTIGIGVKGGQYLIGYDNGDIEIECYRDFGGYRQVLSNKILNVGGKVNMMQINNDRQLVAVVDSVFVKIIDDNDRGVPTIISSLKFDSDILSLRKDDDGCLRISTKNGYADVVIFK